MELKFNLLDLKLNLGCGINKIDGFINIDSWKDSGADIIHDFGKNSLPFFDNTVKEVCLFHTIEHIEEYYHESLLKEIHRVLVTDGIFIVSYPEFLKCVDYYVENKRGQREFFKQTIYGRQNHVGDYHVSLMDTKFFKNKLVRMGFTDLRIETEPHPREYNTVIRAVKGERFKSKSEVLADEIFT